MSRITVGIWAIILLVVMSGCGGGSIRQQDDVTIPGPIDNVEQPGAGGNVSENPGGELDPPDSQEEGFFSNGDRIEAVFVPYVEDVDIPETVIAGQPFEITLHLSTALRPELLNGISSEYTLPGSQFTSDNSIGLAIHLWENPTDFQPVYEHTIQIHPFSVRIEMDSLKVNTADSPEWGGLEVMLNITQGQFAPHEHMVWREYPITVLPAEE